MFSFEWHVCLGLSENNSLVSALALSSLHIQQNPLQIPTSLSNSITSTISKSIKQEFKVIQTTISSSKRPLDSSNDEPSPKRPCHYSMLLLHLFAVVENLQTYLSALRTFMNDKTAMFRSENQLYSTVAIAKALHNVLLIMPTGAGKTISILLPVYLEGSNASTVIFVPLTALVNDLVRECKQRNLSVATWFDRQTPAQVYVISADNTRRNTESFLSALKNSGRLRRIVLDEVHLLLLWSIFRSSFRRLRCSAVRFPLCPISNWTYFSLYSNSPPMYRKNSPGHPLRPFRSSIRPTNCPA